MGLQFACSDLKNVTRFMKNSVKVSEAFQIVYIGLPRPSKPVKGIENSPTFLLFPICSSPTTLTHLAQETRMESVQTSFFCRHGPCTTAMERHYNYGCPSESEEEKQ